MGGFAPLVLPYITRESFHQRSFLVGLAIGGIWNKYKKACLVNRRRASLSLGDFLLRLSERWQKARSDEDELKIAIETRFFLVNFKSFKAKSALIEMADEYDNLLGGFQRFINRDNLPADNKKGALFYEAAKIFPEVKQSDVSRWYDDGMTSVEIAQAIIALKYGVKTSTLKRRLRKAKTLPAVERLRRAWLQSYNNDSDPKLFKDVQSLSAFVREFFHSPALALRDISAKALEEEDPNLSQLSSSLLSSNKSLASFVQK